MKDNNNNNNHEPSLLVDKSLTNYIEEVALL